MDSSIPHQYLDAFGCSNHSAFLFQSIRQIPPLFLSSSRSPVTRLDKVKHCLVEKSVTHTASPFYAKDDTKGTPVQLHSTLSQNRVSFVREGDAGTRRDAG
jgi:hypothetical protein